MTTIAKLGHTGQLQVRNALDNRAPRLQNGLMMHFPLKDNSLRHTVKVENFPAGTIKAISYNSHSTTWRLKNELDNGNIINADMTTNNSLTESQAVACDIVVCDWYVWGVSSTYMSTLRDFADAGAVVWATGNDTLTNVFVAGTTSIGSEVSTTGTFYDNDDIEEILGNEYRGAALANTSTDPASYISSFNTLDTGRIVPLYYHDHVGSAGVMGYMYIPYEGGGSLYFDEFGGNQNLSANRPIYRRILDWQLGRKNAPDYIPQTAILNSTFDKRLHIEKTFDNKVTYTNLDTGWSQSYCTSIQFDDYPKPEGADPDGQVVSFIDADSNGSGYWYSYGNYCPQADNTSYAVSMWMRTEPGGTDVKVKAYTADNSETDRVWSAERTVPADGEWHHIYFMTFTTDTGWDSDSLSFQFTTFPAGQRLWLYGPSCAELPHAEYSGERTFQNTQRSNHSNLKLPLRVGTGDFTVIGYWSPKTDADGSTTYTDNNAVGFRLYDEDDDSYCDWEYYAAGGVSRPFLDPDTNSSWNNTANNNHAHATYTMNASGASYLFLLRRIGNTLKLKWRTVTGSWQAEHNLTTLESTCKPSHIIFGNGSSNMWEHALWDLSIYNHADFTTAELDAKVMADYNTTLPISKEGDLLARLVETEDNLWPNALDMNTTYGVKSGTVTTPTDREYHEMSMALDTSNRYAGHDIAGTNGAYYVFSGEFWYSGAASGNSTGPTLKFEGESGSATNGMNWDQLPYETWTRVTAFCQSDGLVRFLTYPSVTGGETDGTFRWRNMEVRKFDQSELLKIARYTGLGLPELGEVIESM